MKLSDTGSHRCKGSTTNDPRQCNLHKNTMCGNIEEGAWWDENEHPINPKTNERIKECGRVFRFV